VAECQRDATRRTQIDREQAAARIVVVLVGQFDNIPLCRPVTALSSGAVTQVCVITCIDNLQLEFVNTRWSSKCLGPLAPSEQDCVINYSNFSEGCKRASTAWCAAAVGTAGQSYPPSRNTFCR
jgi:hypothetical protein